MSFFSKDQTEKNLQYDDTAFLHFFLTVSICSLVFFGYLVISRLKKSNIKGIKNYTNLHISGLFQNQLKHESVRLKEQYLNWQFYVMLGFLSISIILTVLLPYIIVTHSNQMIGFDPHQILGVSQDSTVQQIKKAYRKLALEHHPDRNPNNPEAHVKFIMISKSYECLTDEQKKLNCQKFGNPDGQSSFQVGIGLPKFIINKQNQYFILPIVLIMLLIIVPIVFMKWTNGAKKINGQSLDVQDYSLLHKYFVPGFHPSFGFFLVAVLKELQTSKKLSQTQKKQLFAHAENKKFVNPAMLGSLTQQQLYTLYRILNHLEKQPDQDLCKKLPQLFNQLMHFGFPFACGAFNGKPLSSQQRLPIVWIGAQSLMMILDFIRIFYNRSLGMQQSLRPFDYFDLKNQDKQTSLKNPLNHFYELLTDQQKKTQHLALFSQSNRSYIEKQLNDIPLLTLEIKIMLQKKEVKNFTTQDQPQIYFRVTKKNTTSGYCYLKNFPYLKEEKYYFLFVHGNNLLHFRQVVFEEGKNIFIGKFPYMQKSPNQMKYFALLLSDCRHGVDVRSELSFQVSEPGQQSKSKGVQIHPEDISIQKLPKSYIQSMLSLQTDDPDEEELSDDENQQKKSQQNLNGEKPIRRSHEHHGCDC